MAFAADAPAARLDDPGDALNLAAYREFVSVPPPKARLPLLLDAEDDARCIRLGLYGVRLYGVTNKQTVADYAAEYNNPASLFRASLPKLRLAYAALRRAYRSKTLDAVEQQALNELRAAKKKKIEEQDAMFEAMAQARMQRRAAEAEAKEERLTIRQAIIKAAAVMTIGENPCMHALEPSDPAAVQRALEPLKPLLGTLVPNACQLAAYERFLGTVLLQDDSTAGSVALGDEAGLGKTITALLAIVHRLVHGPPDGRVIVTLPKAALKAWKDELKRASQALRDMTAIIDKTAVSPKLLDFAHTTARLVLITDTTVTVVWRRIVSHTDVRPFDDAVWGRLRPLAQDMIVCDEFDALLPDQKAVGYKVDKTTLKVTFVTAKTQSIADFMRRTRRRIVVTATAFHGNSPEEKARVLVLLMRPRGLKRTSGCEVETDTDYIDHFVEYKPQFFRDYCIRRLKDDVREHQGMAQPVKHHEPICVQPTEADNLYISAGETVAANPPPEVRRSTHFLQHMARLSEQTLNPELYHLLEQEILEEARARPDDTRAAIRAGVIKERLPSLAESVPLSAVATTAVALMGRVIRDCKGSMICFGVNKWHLEYLEFLATRAVDWGCGCPQEMHGAGELYRHTCGCDERVHVMRERDSPDARANKAERYSTCKTGPSIMIMSEKLGGRALSLPTCNHVLRFVPMLNTAVGIQADARNDRIISHYGDMASDLYYWLVYTPGIVSFIVRYIIDSKLNGTLDLLDGSDETGDGMRKVVEGVAAHVDKEGIAQQFSEAVGKFAAMRKPSVFVDVNRYLRSVPKTPSPPRSSLPLAPTPTPVTGAAAAAAAADDTDAASAAAAAAADDAEPILITTSSVSEPDESSADSADDSEDDDDGYFCEIVDHRPPPRLAPSSAGKRPCLSV